MAKKERKHQRKYDNPTRVYNTFIHMASATLTVKLRQIQKADGINLIHVAMVCIN
jgi:hypothetical protein